MNNRTAPSPQIDPHKLFEVMSRFAGRAAKSTDPAMRDAAHQMKIELDKAKVKA